MWGSPIKLQVENFLPNNAGRWSSGKIALWTAVYALLHAILFQLASSVVGVVEYSLWFPPAGLRFAVLLIFGWRIVPFLVVAEFAAQASLAWAGLHDIGNLEWLSFSILTPPVFTALGIWFLTERMAVSHLLPELRNILLLAMSCVLIPALMAPINVSAQLLSGAISGDGFLGAVLSLWIGDTIGILMLTPILLVAHVVFKNKDPVSRLDKRLIIEVALVSVIGIGIVILAGLPSQSVRWYPALFPLIWLAMRHGLAGAAIGLLLVNVASAFAASFEPTAAARFELQLFLVTASLVTLLLGGLATTQKRAAELLRRRDQDIAHMDRVSTLGKMAASLAHEISQPLGAIATYTQAALDGGDRLEALEQIDGETKRLTQIISRTKTLAQNRPPERAAFSVSQAVTDIEPLLLAEARRHGIDFKFEAPENLPPAFADSVQTQQVVLNLVRNAIDALRSGTRNDRAVSVRLEHAKEQGLVVSVIDNGEGVADDAIPHLFKPFWSSRTEGIGMGLAIAKDIVIAHGGKISAERNEGRGMTFRFTLPIATRDENGVRPNVA